MSRCEQGLSLRFVNFAEALPIDEVTIRNWLAKYRQGGVEELLALNDHGKEPSLTAEQQEEFAQHLDENIDLDSNASGCGNFSRRKFSTINITKRSLNFYRRAKASSAVERSTAKNYTCSSPKISTNTKQTEPIF